MGQRRPELEFEEDSEVRRRSREVQILINVLVPDPDFQPLFLSDRATVFEISDEIEEEIRRKLEFYFRKSLRLVLDQPIWKLVDDLKQLVPGWPDKQLI